MIFVAVSYSLIWLPQIVRSARRGRTSGLAREYVIGTTVCRLYLALCEFFRGEGSWYWQGVHRFPGVSKKCAWCPASMWGLFHVDVTDELTLSQYGQMYLPPLYASKQLLSYSKRSSVRRSSSHKRLFRQRSATSPSLTCPYSIPLSRPMTIIPRCLCQTQKLRTNLSGTAPFVWTPYGWTPPGDTNQRKELRVSGIAMCQQTEADGRVWEVLVGCSVWCIWEWRAPAQEKYIVLLRVIIYLWVLLSSFSGVSLALIWVHLLNSILSAWKGCVLFFIPVYHTYLTWSCSGSQLRCAHYSSPNDILYLYILEHLPSMS